MEEKKELLACVPGQRLCMSDKINIPGRGTFEHEGYIYSKFAGIVKLVKENNY